MKPRSQAQRNFSAPFFPCPFGAMRLSPAQREPHRYNGLRTTEVNSWRHQ